MTEQTTYLTSERHLYKPACPTCASTEHARVEWHQTDHTGERWTPGLSRCRNPLCETNRFDPFSTGSGDEQVLPRASESYRQPWRGRPAGVDGPGLEFLTRNPGKGNRTPPLTDALVR